MRAFLLFKFCVLLAFNGLRAETEFRFLIKQEGGIYEHKVHGAHVYFFTGSNNRNNNFCRMALPKGDIEILDTNISFCQSVKMGEHGAYYISFKYDANGNDGKHNLNYFPYGGQKIDLGVVNHYGSAAGGRPSMAELNNDKYYIYAFYNGKRCFWESDGSIAGTKIIFQTTTLNVISIHHLKSKNYFLVTGNYSDRFVDQDAKTVGSVYNFPQTGNSGMYRPSIFYQNDSLLIYRVRNKLFMTKDFSSIDSLSLNSENLPKFSILYARNSEIIGYSTYPLNQLYRLRYEAPYTYDSLPLSSGLSQFPYVRIGNAQGPYLQVWNMYQGFELAKVENFDSLRLISDYNKGPGSSYFGDNFYGNQSFNLQNDTLYFSGNNGNSDNGYLCFTDGQRTQSVFPVNRWNTDLKHFKAGDYYYWSYLSNDTAFLYFRSMNDTDRQALTKPVLPGSDEWHRASVPISLYNSSNINSGNIIPENVLTDAEGNAIVHGLTRDPYNGHYLTFSDTSLFKETIGEEMIFKYDSTGKLLWLNTVGGKGQYSFSFDISPLTIDGNGDLLLFGKYHDSAKFDEITLYAPRSAFYVCKLDGKTGKTKWAESFSNSYYFNYLNTDGIACDENNNIYLSFTFEDFSVRFKHLRVLSDRSPFNAMAKLSPDGEIQWLQSTLTSWTDRYGRGRSLLYDNKNKQLISLISQGYYNWWASCKYSPFYSEVKRVSTIDGSTKSTIELSGDDLNSAVTATLTANNSVFIAGFYRGVMQSGNRKIFSFPAKKGDCEQSESFSTVLRTENLKAMALQKNEGNPFSLSALARMVNTSMCLAVRRLVQVPGAIACPSENILNPVVLWPKGFSTHIPAIPSTSVSITG